MIKKIQLIDNVVIIYSLLRTYHTKDFLAIPVYKFIAIFLKVIPFIICFHSKENR